VNRRPWSVDEAVLYALVARAWEQRETPQFAEAVAAVLDLFDRSPLTWFERCEQRRARNLWLIDVLRDTDPVERRAAA
jgi:hypothetical protein